MSNNEKSKIWLYAVVLFTSAFIVLLVTAFSQIKLNRNLDDLNNQIFTKEHEKSEVQLSFANAQELNNRLSNDNKKLQEEIDSLKTAIDVMKSDRETADRTNAARLDAYEKLSQAQNEYIRGKPVDSAQIIRDIDPNLLNADAGGTYSQLMDKAYYDAGRQLLNEGYDRYIKKDYAAAMDKLTQAWFYAPDRDYSDKCLYYLALSESKTENTAQAVAHMKTLRDQFASSGYLSAAKKFLAKYPDTQP